MKFVSRFLVFEVCNSLLFAPQAVWNEMRRLSTGDTNDGSGAKSPRESLSRRLFPLHDLSKAVGHGRGALHYQRLQIPLQNRLLEPETL